MAAEQAVLQMVGGDGEYSYATNSWHQGKAIIKTQTVLESAIEEMYKALHLERITVVDLGCSSGPNTLLVVSQILNIISQLHTKSEKKAPIEIQFFLNDLPGNDFNSVFRSLETFRKKTTEEKGDDLLLLPYYVAGAPGSFHGRLFPSSSIHFFHSSYSLHWLSQAPSVRGIPPNKGNIYISKTSPPEILKAYQEQFKSDFSRFLKYRYEELSVGGRMVITYLAKDRVEDDLFIYNSGLLSEVLNSMAIEGIISKEKLDDFNLPMYAPSLEEMKSVILSESSLFHLERADSTNCEFQDYHGSTELDGKSAANSTRAIFESLIADQFGSDMLDELFERYVERVSKSILEEKFTKCLVSYVVLVLTKKAVE